MVPLELINVVQSAVSMKRAVKFANRRFSPFGCSLPGPGLCSLVHALVSCRCHLCARHDVFARTACAPAFSTLEAGDTTLSMALRRKSELLAVSMA